MQYAEQAETNEKSIVRFFLFLSNGRLCTKKIIDKLNNFEYKNDFISKTRNHRKREIDFSLDSAHSASSMHI